jgi:long-chain acyl-CoA synthetase
MASSSGVSDEAEQFRTISRAASHLSKALDTILGQCGMTLAQYRMLSILEHVAQNDADASSLAERLSITRPSVTALVDGLVSRKFVARASDPRDGRRVWHTLTAQGQEALGRADESLSLHFGKVLSVLTPADRDVALRGLMLWGTALDTRMGSWIRTGSAAKTD